ncbi:MAG: U32 family peptidase [Clostridia bacterium]|nr:U32 family peptidase [Clostridia bacterium]
MKNGNIELLAPAGNMECLIAAVRNGADAVYFGSGSFNARRGAANFTGGELEEAIKFCRLRGVKTNITLNTLLFDRELRDAVNFAAKLLSLKADAVIVQDIGLAAILREELPELTVHASTQMGIHSLSGLRYCEANGIARAVLAREVPLDEIRRMHAQSPVELEFFCHGALCMGFSGSCLYSSMAGERSGNRGTCAQPCRKNASVLNRRAGENEFALSTNDICMIDELPALIDAGIVSFKIEGRMKSPEYVANVTRIYRAALDGEKPASARSQLFAVFNRGEFSTAHIRGDSVTTGHVGSAKPTPELVAAAHESVRSDRPVRRVSAELTLTVGEPAKLALVSGGAAAEAFGPVCEEAKKPVDIERYREQLKKFGGTPYYLGDCAVAGNGFIPVSALNALRRGAAAALSDAILGAPAPLRELSDADIARHTGPSGKHNGPSLLYARTSSAKEAAAARADIVGVEPAEPAAFDPASLPAGGNYVLILPNVIMTEGARQAYLRLIASGIFRGIEANNICEWDMGKDLPIRIAGVGMNAMNSASVRKLLSSGFTHVMPSLELTRPQLAALADSFGNSMIVSTYGRAPLMQLMHCPVKEYRGCRGCRGDAGVLTDGEGRRFPLRNIRFAEGYCLVRLMNCAVTDVREAFASSGISVFARAETADPDPSPDITRGHWSRAVD